MSKEEAMRELELVLFSAIQDGLDQDHAHTPYVKALNLDAVSDDDLKHVAHLAAKEIVKRCEVQVPKARADRGVVLKSDEAKV